MFKKVGAVAVFATLISVLVATTAWGSTNHLSAAAAKKVKCGKTVTIGMAYPATGPAATLGATQWDWAQWAKKRWNKSHKRKIRLIPGDTQLGNSPGLAVPVAHSFASNGKILAVVGPAGSQEVQDSISIYAKAGLVAVSGSATRVFLTRAKGSANPRETPKGSFFRTVPNDGEQGDAAAAWIHNHLKFTHVYLIDDEEAYSQGLADQVAADLAKVGITAGRNHISQQATDFSSIITAIPSNTQLVYVPWQLAGQAQTFYQQLKASGSSAIVMGSDGTDVPGQFEAKGGYVSGFPVDFTSPVLKSFQKAHKGQPETFGIPSYTATWVDAKAISMACAAGKGYTTRNAVRKMVQKVKLNKKQSLLGFAVKFLKKNQGVYQAAGDMGGKANFAIYSITSTGAYKRVG